MRRKAFAAGCLVVATLVLLLLASGRGAPTEPIIGPGTEVPYLAASLWPCSLMPRAVQRQLGVQLETSNPPDGTPTPDGSPACAFKNAATTLVVALTVSVFLPSPRSFLSIRVVGLLYVISLGPLLGLASDVGLYVPAPLSPLYNYWAVYVSCRTGCTELSALDIGEAVVIAVAPSASTLVGAAPPGTRYWRSGGKLRAVAGLR